MKPESSKRLYITMSIFIVVMVGGGTVFSFYFEDIQIRWYISKLDSIDMSRRKAAFDWLYEKAKKNPSDERMEKFYEHPNSKSLLLPLEANRGKVLWFCASAGEEVGVRILLKDKNTDVNYLIQGQNPHDAAQNQCHVGIAKLLHQNGSLTWEERCKLILPIQGYPPPDIHVTIPIAMRKKAFQDFIRAIKAGRPTDEVISKMKWWFDFNLKDNDGWTPLHYAARYSYERLTQILIKNGAEVNARANDGNTPLDRACFRNPKKIQAFTALLRNHGAKTGAELKEMQGKKKK